MKRRVTGRAIIDSGFWIALLEPRDQHHAEAQGKTEMLLSLSYLVPWPTLYETLNSRFARRPHLIERLAGMFLKRPNAHIFDDTPYRETALRKTLSIEAQSGRPLSLADNVLREILADESVRLNCIFTFNVSDFSDLCARRHLEII